MSVRNIAGTQISELAIHLVHGDRATFNVNQPMRVASKVSDHSILGVNSDAVSISILRRRGDDRTERDVFNFADALQHVADLARFDFELMRIIDMLIGASAATAEVRARRLHPLR